MPKAPILGVGGDPELGGASQVRFVNRLSRIEEAILPGRVALPNTQGGQMRRMLVIAGLVAVASAALASQATGGTTTVVASATFAEPLTPALNSGCLPSPSYGVCGSGEVNPFGHATDSVVFGGACGGGCDLRTITL